MICGTICGPVNSVSTRSRPRNGCRSIANAAASPAATATTDEASAMFTLRISEATRGASRNALGNQASVKPTGGNVMYGVVVTETGSVMRIGSTISAATAYA